MKKIIAITVALVAFAAVAAAQPRALGVRAGYGGELSYQHSVGSNFAEFDLGLFNNSAALSAIYDFIIAGNGNFNVYAGPGARLGMWTGKENSGFDLGIAGQLGLEYNFSFPLQLSLDWKPVFHFIGSGDFHGFDAYGAALGIRYRF